MGHDFFTIIIFNLLNIFSEYGFFSYLSQFFIILFVFSSVAIIQLQISLTKLTCFVRLKGIVPYPQRSISTWPVSFFCIVHK